MPWAVLLKWPTDAISFFLAVFWGLFSAIFIYYISICIDMNNFLFRALGEDTKFLILKLLLDGELCACKIPAKIKRTQSNTSMHLARLIEWDLIQSRRDGKMILYTIKDKRVYFAFKLLKCQKSKISEHDKKLQFFTGDLK